MKLFCKKTQNFRALGAPPPDPRASGGWGRRPQTPKTAPPLRISGYAPALNYSTVDVLIKFLFLKCPVKSFNAKRN